MHVRMKVGKPVSADLEEAMKLASFERNGSALVVTGQ